MARLPEGILVASIAAVSALSGTLVGAVVTYEGNRQLQNNEVRQDEAHQLTATRAIARLLMSEYQADADRLLYMVASEEYDPESYRERIFVSRLSEEDRKLLAGRLSDRSWTAISRAARQLEIVEVTLEDHHGRGEVGHDELARLEAAEAACKAAFSALTPLASTTTS